MGGILSKPKIPRPSPEQVAAEKEAMQAQQEERALLKEQRASEDRLEQEETQRLQKRRRRARFGGRRSLLADRPMPEMGIPKKDTLGGQMPKVIGKDGKVKMFPYTGKGIGQAKGFAKDTGGKFVLGSPKDNFLKKKPKKAQGENMKGMKKKKTKTPKPKKLGISGQKI